MSVCRYRRKDETGCTDDHDEDVFDEETLRRRIQVRRPIAFVNESPSDKERKRVPTV